MAQGREREVMKAMSRLMLSGWTLTAQTCPVTGCNHPLLKNGDTLYCASCDAPIRVVSAAEAGRFFDRPPAPPGGAAATASPVSEKDRSATASKLLGQKLLSGWCMRAEACSACGTPLMTAKGAPDAFVCVLCGPVAAPAVASVALAPPDAPASASTSVSGEGGAAQHQVLVKGLPFDADESTLRDVLGSCGEIEALDILKVEGRSRGAARVAFAAAAGAQKALALDGTDVGGRVVSVSSLAAGPAAAAPPPPAAAAAASGGVSLLNHLRGYTGDEEDDEEEEESAPLRRGGEGGRGGDFEEEEAGDGEGGLAAGYSDAQWAEAFAEVRRGIEADATGGKRLPGGGGGAEVSQASGGASRLLQTVAPPAVPSVPAPTATPAAAATRVSKADGNVGPSGAVQQISRVFVVPEPDHGRVARLAAGLLLADADDLQTVAAGTRSSAPSTSPAEGAAQPRSLAPQAAARAGLVQPIATSSAAADPSGPSSAPAAAVAASAALSVQLEREVAFISSLQKQPLPHPSDASSGFLTTAPVIAEAAGRIQKLAAAIAALQVLLPQLQ